MREWVWGKMDNYGDRVSMYQILDTQGLVMRTREGENANWPERVTERCLVCQTVPCEPFSCPNGRVAGRAFRTEAAFLNKVMERQSCGRACAVGTFLTCKREGACWYKPVTEYEMWTGAEGMRAWWSYNAFENASDVNLVHPDVRTPPVLDCYPCLFADRRTHFGLAMSTDRGLAQKGFLRFYCPGGALPPEDCPLNQVSKVDPATNTSGACGCAGGYYWSDAEGRCALCPPCHFCAWEGRQPPVRKECPNDTFSEGGAEACRRCNTGRQCDVGQALTRCLQNGATGESGKFQGRDSECVMCAECVQLGAGADGVPCYKVSALAAS